MIQDARGNIPVDEELRTNVDGIWALGDCNGHGGFTHTSYNDFEIVAANLLDNDPRKLSDRIPAYALYIDPPLGRAGLTEAEVRRSGEPALIGTRPMTKVARAIEKGETQGFIKILVDRRPGNFWALPSSAPVAMRSFTASSTRCTLGSHIPSCHAPCTSIPPSRNCSPRFCKA